MLDNENNQAGDDAIEQLLGCFSPAPANIDRDQLMFLAGMRAAQGSAKLLWATRRDRLWPALAMVSTAAAVILGIIAWHRPERIVVVERHVTDQQLVKQSQQSPPDDLVAPNPIPSTVPSLDPALNYVHRRDLMLRDGPEALPSEVVGDTHVARITPTQRELLKELPGGFRQQYQVDSEAWWQSWLISGDRL